MNKTQYPWDLTRVPNYDSAPTVDIEEAERLDARTFQRRYVLQNRPCLVKRAVAQWPAFHRWVDPEYVLSKIGDVEIRASCSPRVEGFGLRPGSQDSIAAKTTRDRLLAAEKVRQLLPRLRTPDDDVLFVELRPADPSVRCLGEDLAAAGARFSFLPDPPLPRFLYSGWAVMFYKNSYSDWHFHPGTEAMMCQVLGTKDVLLLPPTHQSWSQIVPIHAEQWKVYDVDVAKAPAYREVRPYHVVVEPGDGLFLPVNWWHAVQGRPREYGITVPVTWNSPYRDLRQPATRHFLRVLWRYRKLPAATELLASVYGTVASQFRKLASDRQLHSS
ncbi:MAG: cupin-like domain-containing protein [Blastocatellia bacterium]